MTAFLRRYFTLENIRAFYMGRIYPIVVCVLVALGGIFGIEQYLGLVHTAFILGAFLLSESIRPIIISLLTYVMQISVQHSPFYPNYSDFYSVGFWKWAFVAVVIVTSLGALVFIIKNKIYKRVSFEKTPMLLPLIILSVVFFTNGIFSEKWTAENLIFGITSTSVYALLFILIYHGFSDKEHSEELAGYFAYITVLISLVISAELIALFLTSDGVFLNGSIVKESVALGWGIWNLIGVSLSVLIPVLFYGMNRSRYPLIYFAVATLTYVMAVLTMSRNALVFASLAYVSSVIIFCFVGNNKKMMRIIATLGVIAVIVFAVVFWDKIYALLGDYFSRGFSDNGRFTLWKTALANFKDSPIFGSGFYGFYVEGESSFGPLPMQAHNTVLQLLSLGGIIVLISYLYYRYKSILPIFRRPTTTKSMLGISIAVLLLSSLLDNFIFNVYPMFYYTVALVIIHKSSAEGK